MNFPVFERVYLIQEFKTNGIAMQISIYVLYGITLQCGRR